MKDNSLDQSSDKQSYKDAVKSTTLFGGVQIFNIIIRIIRSKAIAILLGPNGMGIAGLFRSTLETISAFSGLGLGQSAVRNIAEANGTNDSRRISSTIFVFKRLIWITGIIGTVLCAVFAGTISNVTFGHRDYTIAFVILSVSVLFLQLTSGETAVLQGLQKYKGLAKANVWGSIVGLLVTLPLYYFWGIDAIVPVLLLTYVIAFCCAKFYARTIKVGKVEVPPKERKAISYDMIKLGIVLSLQGFLTFLSSYLIRIYIRQEGGLEDVGLYNAGFTIVNTYIGMIFTAMATDYYPRLSKCSQNIQVFKQTINNQLEVVFLLMTPMVVLFMVYIRPVVILLYSNQFLPVESMVYWTMAAMIFKAMSWGLSFGLVAKGAIKAYSYCEFSVIIYGLIFNVIGYKYWGLVGLGMSHFFMYLIYFIHVLIVSRRQFDFKFISSVKKSVVLAAFFVGVILVITYSTNFIVNNQIGMLIRYLLGTIVCILAIIVYYKKLTQIIPIKETITKFLRK